jgi:putative transcriptional regulator
MTLPTHHPGDMLLMDYASGSLGEATSVVIATHLALCPGCRHAVSELEAVGGALLEAVEPDPMSPGALDTMLARLDEADEPVSLRRPRSPAGTPVFPEPLRSYVGEDPALLRWRPILPGMRCVTVSLGRGGDAWLLRAKGGVAMPQHSHEGLEMVLVLQGSYSDSAGHFMRGDVEISDGTVDHKPVAEPEGCLCLTVNIGQLRLTGPIGRFLNPLLQI